jgi:hypothetical protein
VSPSPQPAAGEAGAASGSLITAALALGWQMAELYRGAGGDPDSEPATLPQQLPPVSALDKGQRTALTLAQVEAGLERLNLTASGLSVASARASHGDRHKPLADLQREIYRLHLRILSSLSARDFDLSKAYGVGRSLADTSPENTDPGEMAEALNRHRLDQIGRWLADLASALPDHASRAVRISMARWKVGAKQGQGAELFEAGNPRQLHRSLQRQVELWRALLTEEKRAHDMLDASDYLQAVALTLRGARSLVLGFLWRFLPFVAIVLAVVGVGIWGLTEYEAPGKLIAAGAAVAGGLGLSFKGTASTVGRVAEKVGGPTWEAALDLAIANAITQWPASKVQLAGAAEVAPAAGGSPSGKKGEKLLPRPETDADLPP